MDFLAEFEKFLFTLMGALIGGTLVAWGGGYYSEKGKRELVQEEWPKLLKESREKAYQEEAGKRLATKDDINNVLEQVKAVTRETESVKAEITGGLWHLQWRLTQKRDSYVRLIDALENLQLRRIKVRTAASDSSQADAYRDLREATEEFRRARAISRLLLSTEVLQSVSHVLRKLEAANPATCDATVYQESEDLIRHVRDQVVILGRMDLDFREK